eukprot:5171773-Karenia_brevis.AAC.1
MQSGSIRTQHYLKPHALSVPLDPHSAHYFPCHKSWPAAVVRKAINLSSTPHRKIAVDAILSRLRSSNSHALTYDTAYEAQFNLRKADQAEEPCKRMTMWL